MSTELNCIDHDSTMRCVTKMLKYKETLKEFERVLKQFVKSYELNYKSHDNGLYPPPDFAQVPFIHETYNKLLDIEQSIVRMIKQICDY